MKTIKQIAAELGVSKQRVYRYIKKHRIGEAHQRNGVMWYDDTAESLIKLGFTKNDVHHEALHNSSSEAVIDTVVAMLQRELDIKNLQIEKQQETIQQLTTALTAAQALHAGTIHSNKHLTGFSIAGTASGEPAPTDTDGVGGTGGPAPAGAGGVDSPVVAWLKKIFG